MQYPDLVFAVRRVLWYIGRVMWGWRERREREKGEGKKGTDREQDR